MSRVLGNGHALVLRGARHSNVSGLPDQSEHLVSRGPWLMLALAKRRLCFPRAEEGCDRGTCGLRRRAAPGRLVRQGRTMRDQVGWAALSSEHVPVARSQMRATTGGGRARTER